MSQTGGAFTAPEILPDKPLQAAKFRSILLALVLAVAGFFRLLDPAAAGGAPTLLDGQFLALVLLPVVSLGLILIVFIETVVSGFRSLRSDRRISDQLHGRTGYFLLRGTEAGLAVIGLAIMASAVPVLMSESTPAPAGVGVMLLLFVVGLGIMFVSLVLSSAEPFIYTSAE